MPEQNGTKSLFGRSPPAAAGARREAARSSSAEAQKRWPARREGRRASIPRGAARVPERTLSGAAKSQRQKRSRNLRRESFSPLFPPSCWGKKKEAPAVKVIKPFRVGSNNSKNKRSQKLSSEAPVFSHERVNLLKQNQVRAAPCFFSDRHTSEAREHGWFPSLQIS